MRVRAGVQAVLAVLLLMTGGTVQAAAGGKPNYRDVQRETPWALAHVAELVQRGIFTGYEDGSFRPNRDVSRIEAIAAAVRLAGFGEEAESEREKSKRLRAEDAELIRERYAWAAGYVAVAERKRLLPGEAGERVRPGDPAERWWATALVLNAYGLSKEAKKMADEALPFADAEEIPEEGAGYAALAYDLGIAKGYTDGTFRPLEAVSRAELAALMDRTGDIVPPEKNAALVQFAAKVSGTSGGRLTVTVDGASQPFEVAKDATFVRDNAFVSLQGLRAGDEITALIRKSDYTVLHVTVTKPASRTKPAETGSHSGTETGSGKGSETTTEDPEEKAAHVPENGRVIGRVTEVEEERITITAADGTTYTYQVSPDVTVVLNNQIVQRSAVQMGDQVDAVIYNGEIFHIRITATHSVLLGEVRGYISAVYETQVLVAQNGRTQLFHVNPDAKVFRGGTNTVELKELIPGDEIVAFLKDGAIWQLTVVEPVKDEYFFIFEGTYAGHYTDHQGNMTEITVTGEWNGNPITRTFPLSEKAQVLHDGEWNSPPLLSRNSKVKLTVVDGEANVVEIQNHPAR